MRQQEQQLAHLPASFPQDRIRNLLFRANSLNISDLFFPEFISETFEVIKQNFVFIKDS